MAESKKSPTEDQPAGRVCQNCLAWVRLPEMREGLCRRRAPQRIWVYPIEGQDDFRSPWPVTGERDYCLEHQEGYD